MQVQQINTPLHTPLVTLLMLTLQAHARATVRTTCKLCCFNVLRRYGVIKSSVAWRRLGEKGQVLTIRPTGSVIFRSPGNTKDDRLYHAERLLIAIRPELCDATARIRNASCRAPETLEVSNINNSCAAVMQAMQCSETALGGYGP
jgi:hypothetical protein